LKPKTFLLFVYKQINGKNLQTREFDYCVTEQHQTCGSKLTEQIKAWIEANQRGCTEVETEKEKANIKFC
jgi:hypothetical protein